MTERNSTPYKNRVRGLLERRPAKRTFYNGRMYASKMEADYAAELDMRLRAKDIRSWAAQVVMPLMVNDTKICDYIIDFSVVHNDDTVEYVEVKGYEEAVWKLKWKLFNALMGDAIVAQGGKITLAK